MQEIVNILSSVGFNWHVALANFVNFLIILWLLNRFVFRRIGRAIDDRDQVIKQGLIDAQDAGRAKHEAESRKSEIIKDAEVNAHAIVNDAHKKAELLTVEMKEKATQEAHVLVREAEEKKAHALFAAEKEFKAQAPALVAALTEKALRETMTKEINDKIVAASSR